MTNKPMTPREDVEALANSMEFRLLYESSGEASDKPDECATMLRALLAERDTAYRRGQEDMRDAALKAVSATQSEILLAAGEMTAQELRTAKAVLAWKQRMIANLPIKETPDV